MNRRSFFKLVTGFVAGVVAAFAPGKKAYTSSYAPPVACGVMTNTVGPERRSGAKFICNMRCNCRKERLQEHGGRMLVVCPHLAPYWVNSDGTQEDFKPTELPCKPLVLTKHSSVGWTETDIAPTKIIHKGIDYEQAGHS